MNIVTIVQARTGSTRLPAKVLMPLAGKPLLMRMLERIQQSKLAGTLCVATTYLPEDLPVAQLCHDAGIPCYRGHPTDLLARHYEAALMWKADAVVKIPSDCPLIDPKVIDKVIGFFIQADGTYDYVSNLHPATFPDGNDVEIMKWKAFETALKEASQPHEREHTTPFLFQNPNRFLLGNVVMDKGLNLWDRYRLTIDYPEDYQVIRSVYEALHPQNPHFGLNDITGFLDEHPHINDINLKYRGESWLKKHLEKENLTIPN